MTNELTMEGLFSYFSPAAVEKLIALPLVRRNICAQDYERCKDTCANARINSQCADIKNTVSTNAILRLITLQHAPLEDVLLYLSIEEVRRAYVHCYGDFFSAFESKILQTSEQRSPLGSSVSLCPVDSVQEKTIMLGIQASVSLTMQEFSIELQKQDLLLQEIAGELAYQAGRAQNYMLAVQTYDEKYKQTVINLAFSVLKVGLSVVQAAELVNVGQAISAIASDSFAKSHTELSSIISGLQSRISNTYIQVIEDAERELLSATSPEEIARCWRAYRSQIFNNANELIKEVYQENFFRSVIQETLHQGQGLTQEMLLINATEKAQSYILEVLNGLKSQVEKIRRVKDSVMTPEGGKKIEVYFRKICLINYTLSLESSNDHSQKWLTKKLGHRLSFYFPDVIFQKKWTSSRLQNFFYHGVAYCKRKMPLEEFQRRRQNSPVVLGLFSNSSRARQLLVTNLEEQIPQLSDQLVKELQLGESSATAEFDDVSYNSSIGRSGRYCLKQRQSVMFNFAEPLSEENTIKAIPVKSTGIAVCKEPKRTRT